MKQQGLVTRHYKYTDVKKEMGAHYEEPYDELINDYNTRFLFERELSYYRKMRILAINDEFYKMNLDEQREVNPLLNYYRPKPRAPLHMPNRSRSVLHDARRYLQWKQAESKVEVSLD